MVEELARCGVRQAVASPGSRSTPLALALWRQPAIEVTVIVDERSAGFFALGAAQSSGRPVAALCTSGTAAANLHPAVCEADEAAVPLIALTADRPPELRGIGAGQTMDQLKLYGEAVRWFCEVGTHEADDAGLLHFRSVACRAYAAARGEPRPGPVQLNVAFREPLGPEPRPDDVTASSPLALEGRGERPLSAVAAGHAPAEEALLDELAERVGESPRGLIVCGRQADERLAAPVAALAAAAGYPILAEPTSQVRLGSHARDLVVWPYDWIARLRPAELEPEVVIRFGDMPTSKALRVGSGHRPGDGVARSRPDPHQSRPCGNHDREAQDEVARLLEHDAPSLRSGATPRARGGTGRQRREALQRVRAGDAVDQAWQGPPTGRVRPPCPGHRGRRRLCVSLRDPAPRCRGPRGVGGRDEAGPAAGWTGGSAVRRSIAAFILPRISRNWPSWSRSRACPRRVTSRPSGRSARPRWNSVGHGGGIRGSSRRSVRCNRATGWLDAGIGASVGTAGMWGWGSWVEIFMCWVSC